jgi:acetyl esterase
MTVRSLSGRPMAVVGVLFGLTLVCWSVWAQPPRRPGPLKPPPAYPNVRYGPHERNVLDVWRAIPAAGRANAKGQAETQGHGTPVVVFFHGGAFRQGDKSGVPAWLLVKCLSAGIAVASANYRLSQHAPYPAPMLDGARAIQYLRLHAKEFGIDPNRIGASGSSAGAGIALWVGFHHDLADPKSPDPVLRQSSRVTCLGVDGAQTSYDPRFIKRVIGGRAHEHSALRQFYGLADSDLGTPRTHQLFEDASPITHATAGDPPVILFYVEPDEPLPDDARPGQGIHHPRFGAALKAKLDPLGVECLVRHARDFPVQDDPDDTMFREMTAFFGRHLRD